jgi:hypothetical protein
MKKKDRLAVSRRNSASGRSRVAGFSRNKFGLGYRWFTAAGGAPTVGV